MKKRGQLALEYLILLAIVIAALSPLIYSQINKYIVKQRINDANVLGNNIAKAADSLYALGPGNQKYLYIDVPKGIQSVNIYQRELSFTLLTPEGTQDIIYLTQGYVTGVIPIEHGTHRIPMSVLGNGVVLIGYPYCTIRNISTCTGGLNSLAYLQDSHNSMVSFYPEGSNYSICCKNTIELSDGNEQNSIELFWLNNEISSHVSQNNSLNYNIPLWIKPVNPDYELDCKYVNKSVDFCSEFGPDYYCLATLENNYINESEGGLIEPPILSNSHVSDCDGDFDDLAIKVCCIIPSG